MFHYKYKLPFNVVVVFALVLGDVMLSDQLTKGKQGNKEIKKQMIEKDTRRREKGVAGRKDGGDVEGRIKDRNEQEK